MNSFMSWVGGKKNLREQSRQRPTGLCVVLAINYSEKICV